MDEHAPVRITDIHALFRLKLAQCLHPTAGFVSGVGVFVAAPIITDLGYTPVH